MDHCTKCGAPLSPGQKACEYCGTVADMMNNHTKPIISSAQKNILPISKTILQIPAGIHPMLCTECNSHIMAYTRCADCGAAAPAPTIYDVSWMNANTVTSKEWIAVDEKLPPLTASHKSKMALICNFIWPPRYSALKSRDTTLNDICDGLVATLYAAYYDFDQKAWFNTRLFNEELKDVSHWRRLPAKNDKRWIPASTAVPPLLLANDDSSIYVLTCDMISPDYESSLCCAFYSHPYWNCMINDDELQERVEKNITHWMYFDETPIVLDSYGKPVKIEYENIINIDSDQKDTSKDTTLNNTSEPASISTQTKPGFFKKLFGG